MQPIKIRHFQNRQFMHDNLGCCILTLKHWHIHTSYIHMHTHTHLHKQIQLNIIKYVNWTYSSAYREGHYLIIHGNAWNFPFHNFFDASNFQIGNALLFYTPIKLLFPKKVTRSNLFSASDSKINANSNHHTNFQFQCM